MRTKWLPSAREAVPVVPIAAACRIDPIIAGSELDVAPRLFLTVEPSSPS